MSQRAQLTINGQNSSKVMSVPIGWQAANASGGSITPDDESVGSADGDADDASVGSADGDLDGESVGSVDGSVV